MSATVGGLVEEVAPRRMMLGADRAALAVLVLASVALHAWLIGHTHTTARDAIRFARTAMNLEHPDASRTAVDVLRDAKLSPDPPGFPLAVLGVSKIVREITKVSLPEQMLMSAQIASSLAAILLVFPSYWLGRMLFCSPKAGFAAALLFQLLPTAAQITSDGLSDSSSLLCILTSLVCGVRALNTQSTKWFLAAGLASGCGFLVRPEGIIAAIGISLCILVLIVQKAMSYKNGAGRLAALLAGAGIIAVPYMLLIGGVSNKPSVNEPLKKLLPARMMVHSAPPRTLFAEWYSGEGSQTVWALKAIAKETGKTSHYAVAIFGLFGVVMLIRKMDIGLMLILVTALLQVGMLLALALKPMPSDLRPGSEAVPPYVSERHTLLLAYFCCLFTGGLLHLMPRCGWCVLIALASTMIPSAVKPLHANRAGHLHAGRFLQGKIGPQDALIDPFEWAQWYSGRSLTGVPADPSPEELQVRWVVWEPTAGTKQNPHSRLPRLEAARSVVEDKSNPPVLVYQWPENVEPKDAKVVVYRQMVK